nr:flagellar associated protein [Volvox reticuliferus]BCL66279.1 flagellar associated protein [Volvox reticuliferus]
MKKNIFIYPCDSFVGREVANAFSAAGHAVSGLAIEGANIPSSVKTVIQATDADAAAAHKQLLLTADVVIYDLLGNERATRDAVVQLSQQPYGGREVLFVAVSSPLVWAATRPNPESLFAAAAAAGSGTGAGATGSSGEWGGAEGQGVGADEDGMGGEGLDDAPWPGAVGRSGSGAGTGSGYGDELAAPDSALGAPVPDSGREDRPLSALAVAPTFRAPEDVPRRLPAATARTALAVEHLVLRAGRRGRLRTAVVCPGLLYGGGEDDLAFCNAFKAAWTWQCRPTRGFAAAVAAATAAATAGGNGDKDAVTEPGSAPPRLLVYGRGTNIIPTLHVADLAAYVMALAGAGTGADAQAPGAAAVAAGAAAGGTAAAVPGGTASSTPANGGASGAVSVLMGSGFGFGGSAAGGAPNAGGSSSYLLVTDGSRFSQMELMTAIATAMGVGPEEGAIQTIPESELHLHPAALRSRMLLDLNLVTTPLPPPAPSAPAPAFSLSRPGGLTAHLPHVVTEFRNVRNLNPLRLLVTGPPLSGKTHLARRLAHRYGLTYINVPLLLAAAADAAVATAAGLSPSLDASLLRQAQLEVAAGPSSAPNPKEKEKEKEGPNPGWLPTGGRVSARTLGALLASALSDPRCAARCRGFVLDGYPRSAAQARAAFYTLQVDEAAMAAMAAEQSHAKLGSHKSHRGDRGGDRAASLVATPSTPNVAAALTATVGGCADILDVPPAMKLVPNPLTAPTHVIELDVAEEELRARLAAVIAAADEVVTRVTGEPSTLADDKKAPGAKKPAPTAGAAGGKGGLAAGVTPRDLTLAAALGHNSEAGFVRRTAAYAGWRAEDSADLRSRVTAAQAAWEAEVARQAAEKARLAAEAGSLKAKRRRARAAAAAATGTGSPEDDEDDVAAGNVPDAGLTAAGPAVAAAAASSPELPQHGGLMALSLGAAGATHMRLSNPTVPPGPMVTIAVQPPPQAALVAMGAAAATSGNTGPTSIASSVSAAAAQVLSSASPPPPLPPLPPLERSVEVLLGPPHNLAGFPEPGPTAVQSDAAATTEPAAVAATMPPATAPSAPSSLAAAAAAAGAPPPAMFVTATGPLKPGLPPPPFMSSAASERADAALPGSTAISAAAAVTDSDSKAAETGTPRSSLPPLPPAAAAAAETMTAQAEAVAAGAEASYGYRWQGSRGAAVRRYLLRHVIPVVTAALAEVALARTGSAVPPGSAGSVQSSGGSFGQAPGGTGSGSGSGTGSGSGSAPGSRAGTPGDVPSQLAAAAAVGAAGAPVAAPGPGSTGKDALLHVARALAAAAEAAEAAFQDPYSDPAYAIQLAKIDAKAAREAARAASAAAKAEREAAARQHLHPGNEEEQPQAP